LINLKIWNFSKWQQPKRTNEWKKKTFLPSFALLQSSIEILTRSEEYNRKELIPITE
jgi:hypothetical protein